jgi:hypothetical protein
MKRKHLPDQLLAVGREADEHEAPIGPASLPLDQPAPLEVVHDEGHVAIGPEDLPGQIALMQRPEVMERVEDAELALAEVVLGESAREARSDGAGGPGELHPGVHRQPLVPGVVDAGHESLKRRIVEC